MPADSQQTETRITDIESAVRALVPGEVVSYGEIARRAGLPRRARLVGRVLRETTADLPWHRVVRADGRIAFPEDSQLFHTQVQRLQAEGIKVTEGRVKLDDGLAREASLDEILWSGP